MHRDEGGSGLQHRSLPKIRKEISQEAIMQWRELTEYLEE
jgi:hypothetical protein